MTLRKKFFWISDKIFKNSAIKDHYNEISMLINGTVKQVSNQSLKKLLYHAQNSTKFYKNATTDYYLQDFPIIDKRMITENFDSFLSNDFKDEELNTVVTSGSTGTPFKILQSNRKKNRNTADTIYFADKSGFSIGDKLYYFKIWNDINKKGSFKNFLQNIIPIDVMKTSDEDFETLLSDFESNRRKIALLGYSSFYDQLCDYLDEYYEKPLDCKVSSIISMAESLSEPTRRKMEFYFQTPVVARYSNSENGIIAQEEKYSSGTYRINEASYVVELLEFDSDNPVGENKLGRIVVTDLYNYAMPLIRYDTGDAGMLFMDQDGRKYLKNIEGRVMDLIYDTNGNLVSSFTITNNMWKYKEINQYQFLQTGHCDYVFKLNMGNKKFERERELKDEFVNYFGSGAKIKVKYVNEIPVLRSGKRKKVVNCLN